MQIKSNPHPWVVGAIYRSPDSEQQNNHHLNESIKYMYHTHDKLLVIGDFSMPQIIWNKGMGIINSAYSLWEPEEDFLLCLDDCFLYQQIDVSTRHGAEQHFNTLDLVLTKDEDKISDIAYEPPLGKSDHSMIMFQLNVSNQNVEQQNLLKPDWNRAHYNAIKNYLKSTGTNYLPP